MHIQTHVLSGWCLGNLLTLSKRERLFSMIAASFPDIDGLSLLGGATFYWKYHHIVAHNLLVCLLLSLVLTLFSQNRLKAFALYVFLFHIHLILDYFGSGLGWGFSYFWPFSTGLIENHNAWSFFSWQNIGVFMFFLVWTLMIIIVKGRTPLELLFPSLDKKIVLGFQKITRYQQQT